MRTMNVNGDFRVDDDDDIQLLYSNTPSESVLCQMCNIRLDKLSLEQRQAHYEMHFQGDPQVHVPSASLSKPPFKWKDKAANEKKDIFWYPAKNTRPPRNYTPGLIPVLKRALLKSHGKGNTTRAALCFDRTVHICRENWDALWGCGYRNFLMVCTALMEQNQQPMYFALLDHPIPPGVKNLQRWIEAAWRNGFDREGANQLKNQLVDTHKWIGAAELYVAFTSRGIPVELVDFDLKNEPKGAQVVIDWVVQYFSPSHPQQQNLNDRLRGVSAVTVTDRMPLVLQHQGHSRTIVGYEIGKTGTVNLIVFDPSQTLGPKYRNATTANLGSAELGSGSGSGRKLVNKVLATVSNKRKVGTEESSQPISNKRHRSEDVIVIDSDSEGATNPAGDHPKLTTAFGGRNGNPEDLEELNHVEVINKFKLDPKKLSKKSNYQILYFPYPLGAPLGEKERLGRRIVKSTKIS